MKRFFVFFVLFIAAAGAPAVQFIATEKFTLNPDQTLTNECWVAAQDIEVNGLVKDDFMAVCVGGPILFGHASLRGTFDNDVWALGNSVEFTGTTAEHGRLFATSEIVLGGKVGISAVAVGKTVTLTTNAVVIGDALLVGESVVMSGDIQGNLRILADTATVGGHIDGNVRIVANDIILMPGTKINGDLVYTSSKDLFLDPGKVALNGQLIRKEFETVKAKAPSPSLYDIFLLQAYFYLCALVAGVPFVAIFSRFTGRAVRWIRQSIWKCMLVGFIAFCLIPMTSLFVLLTLVGIPLSILLLLAYVILIYLSKIIVALGIGGFILHYHGPQPFSRVFVALSLGLIAIYLVTALPLIGSIAAIVVLLAGLGGMILAILSSHVAADQSLPPPIRQTTTSFDSQATVSQKKPSIEE